MHAMHVHLYQAGSGAARGDIKAKRRGVLFFSSRRRHTRLQGDWSSDVCSSDLDGLAIHDAIRHVIRRGVEVKIIVQGMAYSMGSIVLQAASDGKRLAFPHSWIMIDRKSVV